MNIQVFPSASAATAAAADKLAGWLTEPGTRNLMVAGGNSPLDLYSRIAGRGLRLGHLRVFMLDEYVGVPPDEPRNCANLLRRSVIQAWGIPESQYFTIGPVPAEALAAVQRHERRIADAGGLDVLILGLGQNGHLGFNEPGSEPDSRARLVALEPVSIEANRAWFSGKHAPAFGATVGLATLLEARHILVLAFGPHKSAAVRAMSRQAPGPDCPASFLQRHPDTWLFLDSAAAVYGDEDGA